MYSPDLIETTEKNMSAHMLFSGLEMEIPVNVHMQIVGWKTPSHFLKLFS